MTERERQRERERETERRRERDEEREREAKSNFGGNVLAFVRTTTTQTFAPLLKGVVSLLICKSYANITL